MVAITVTLGLCWSILSFGFFVICRYFARPLAVITPITKNNEKVYESYIQTPFTYSNAEQWERLNLLISWLHSLITGLSTIYCFWMYSPYMYRDMVNHISLVTYLTCSLSYGMFRNK